MQTVIICQGLPASGKSTWAKEYCENHTGFFRVNKDTIRKNIVKETGKKWNHKVEKEVEQKRDEAIRYFLENGYSVISDDTNLNQRHVVRITQLANEILGNGNYELIINDIFTKVPVNECIQRDSLRSDDERVGKKVIIEMWRKYLEPEPTKWEQNKKPTAIIVDLDGTLALFWRKSPYNRDFENDIINVQLLTIIKQLHANGNHILFTSGRSDEYRNQTIQFLNRCGFDYEIERVKLLMRNKEDKRPDFEVKRDIYEKCIQPYYNVMCAFDDRPQVKRLWVSLGIYVFDCNQHSLDF